MIHDSLANKPQRLQGSLEAQQWATVRHRGVFLNADGRFCHGLVHQSYSHLNVALLEKLKGLPGLGRRLKHVMARVSKSTKALELHDQHTTSKDQCLLKSETGLHICDIMLNSSLNLKKGLPPIAQCTKHHFKYTVLSLQSQDEKVQWQNSTYQREDTDFQSVNQKDPQITADRHVSQEIKENLFSQKRGMKVKISISMSKF